MRDCTFMQVTKSKISLLRKSSRYTTILKKSKIHSRQWEINEKP